MKIEDKNKIIDSLTDTINSTKYLYLTDISELNAEDNNRFRRKCYEKAVKLVFVKNTLLKKALENCKEDYNELFDTLKYSTSIMVSDTANLPAKLIKDFRKKNKTPILKAAYVEEKFYFGDDQLDMLVSLKSKEELISHIIVLLQSPIINVLSALQSGNSKLAGIVKTLSEKK